MGREPHRQARATRELGGEWWSVHPALGIAEPRELPSRVSVAAKVQQASNAKKANVFFLCFFTTAKIDSVFCPLPLMAAEAIQIPYSVLPRRSI